jgi:hypothetical protein
MQPDFFLWCLVAAAVLWRISYLGATPKDKRIVQGLAALAAAITPLALLSSAAPVFGIVMVLAISVLVFFAESGTLPKLKLTWPTDSTERRRVILHVTAIGIFAGFVSVVLGD